MDKKGEIGRELLVMLLFLAILAARFQRSFSAASQSLTKEKSARATPSKHRRGSSVVFPVTGNVYPLGYYSVILHIGNPPKPYVLDVDTGSDITWVQCDAPCNGCTEPPDKLYKPKENIVPCTHRLCTAIHAHSPENYHCEKPNEQCDYEVEYADSGSSLGVLVSDHFPLQLTNGSLLRPRLAFGCGYDLRNPGGHLPPPTCGILGLGRGKASINSQLQNLGVSQNVVGHCLSSAGAGFLFFGDDLLPSSGITWTPMTGSPFETHYLAGPMDIFLGGKIIGLKGLEVIFDCGSSYTYFNAQVYQNILDQVKADLIGTQLTDAPDDKELAVCWKATKPIKSICDIKSHFKPISLIFKNSKNAKLQLPPENYLIITNHGNVCLGILNGTEQGLGSLNVIGDIFLQDIIVIYDNEKQQLGWFTADCNRLPNGDYEYDEGLSQPYAANFGIAEEHHPTSYEKSCKKAINLVHEESCLPSSKRKK